MCVRLIICFLFFLFAFSLGKQFSCWVDAVIFVFSVTDESSFNALHSYFSTMFHLRSRSQEVPIFLVASLDGVADNRPRVVDEKRARRLAADMKQATYFETCAVYGHNVEQMFHDACRRMVETRNVENLGGTPQKVAAAAAAARPLTPSGVYRQITNSSGNVGTPLGNITNNNNNNSCLETPTTSAQKQQQYSSNFFNINKVTPLSANQRTTNPTPKPVIAAKPRLTPSVSSSPTTGGGNNTASTNTNIPTTPTPAPPPSTGHRLNLLTPKRSESVKTSAEVANNGRRLITALTPSSNNEGTKESKKKDDFSSPTFVSPVTPVAVRKNRRKSNLFTPLSSKSKNEEKYKNGEVGSGRTIPVSILGLPSLVLVLCC